MERESEILKTLNDAAVRNVPIYHGGGDVLGLFQRTITQDYSTKDWRTGDVDDNLTPRIHHLVLTDYYEKSVSQFETSRDMFQIVQDAFTGHLDAYEKCKILHLDVSDNDVRFREKDGKGVLADWDLAIRIDPTIENVTPRTRYRTGTWYFMSIAMLGNPSKVHDLQDDLESFFYLVLYLTLRYLPTSIELGEIDSRIEQIFGTSFYLPDEQTHVGGSGKSSMIAGAPLDGPLKSFNVNNGKALTSWIYSLLIAIRKHREYAVTNSMMSLTGVAAGIQPISPPSELSNHEFIKELFREALKDTDWSRLKRLDLASPNANETLGRPTCTPERD